MGNILLGAIPGAESVERADHASDKSGVDYWVVTRSGRRFGVDLKARRDDYVLRGRDDLALETWSVVQVRKPGWTWDAGKRCDFILWIWRETGRWCLISFPQLCAVMQRHWKAWRKTYSTKVQKTEDHGQPYHSECVFVPRETVWQEILALFGGQPISVVTQPVEALPPGPISPPFTPKEQLSLWPDAKYP